MTQTQASQLLPVSILFVSFSEEEQKRLVGLLYNSGLNVDAHIATSQQTLRAKLDKSMDVVIVNGDNSRIRPNDVVNTIAYDEVDTTCIVYGGNAQYAKDALAIGIHDTVSREETFRLEHIIKREISRSPDHLACRRTLHAQRMETLGRMMGVFVHDFNNLLTVILTSAELASAKAGTDSPIHGKLKQISGASCRASELTRTILKFSREETDEMDSVDPRDLLQELETLLQGVMGSHLCVNLTIPDSLWRIRAKASQLMQVFLNICVNAKDALEQSGSRLDIVACNLELSQEMGKLLPGRYILVEICDDGCGIPESIRDRIFEPYFTTKAVDKGTGLGLATAASIINNHGGVIQVDSEPSKGTSFHILLPAEEEQAELEV